jgi:hypothetical protein
MHNLFVLLFILYIVIGTIRMFRRIANQANKVSRAREAEQLSRQTASGSAPVTQPVASIAARPLGGSRGGQDGRAKAGSDASASEKNFARERRIADAEGERAFPHDEQPRRNLTSGREVSATIAKPGESVLESQRRKRNDMFLSDSFINAFILSQALARPGGLHANRPKPSGRSADVKEPPQHTTP